MKGKKTDAEFLSSFIESCIVSNKNTTEDILSEAKFQLENIEKKIIEAERLKVTRSKLLDVISMFEKPSNVSKSNDAKVLPLFKITNTDVCKYICDKVKRGPVKVATISDGKLPKQDVMFCLKQLLENKVIIRAGDMLVCGDMFTSYNKLVLCNA